MSLPRTTANYAAIPIVPHDGEEFAGIGKPLWEPKSSRWCKLLALNGNEVFQASCFDRSIDGAPFYCCLDLCNIFRNKTAIVLKNYYIIT